MFVPLLDMLLAIMRRTRAGRSPFSPDKMHLHHRLLQIGHSHRRVVLLIYLWVGMVAFGAVAVTLFDTAAVFWIMCAGLVVAAVVSSSPAETTAGEHDHLGWFFGELGPLVVLRGRCCRMPQQRRGGRRSALVIGGATE